MLTRISLKLKDKRVDKILASKNYDYAEIFYSPISTWILFLALIMPSVAFLFFNAFIWKYWYFIVLYFIISYLINAYLNNSFAVYEDKLFVINPNFPFRRFEIIKREDTKLITINNVKRQFFFIFMAFGGCYLSINVPNKKMKFHCAGLDLDSYDENWTEKTIDDLYYKLVQNKFQTEFNITF